MTTTKMQIPAKVELSEAGEITKVSIRGYSGNSVDLSDYGVDAPVVYLMSGINTNRQKIPYLLNHSHNQILGHTESITNSKEIVAVAVHSYPSTLSKETAGAIGNGVPYQASMGLELDLDSVTYHAEGVVEANGRTFNAPIYTVGKSELVELSATLFGRDGDTEVTKLSKETLMTIKNNKPGGSPGKEEPVVDPALALQEELKNAKAELEKTKAELAKKETPAPANGGMPDTFLNALEMMEEYPDHKKIVLNGIKKGFTKEQIENEIKVEKMVNSFPGVPGVHVPDNKVENTYTARIALSLGVQPEFLEKKVGKPAVDNAMKQGHIGLKESLMLCANANGGRFNGHSDSVQLSKFVKNLKVNNAFSTIDFPNLMHQITEWRVEEAWMLDAPFAPEICLKQSNKDFRPTGHIKPKGGEMWNGLNNEGKINHATFGEEDKYLTRLHTFAQIVTFKREDIINDDIGWIAQLLDLMVEGATMIPDYQLVNLIYNATTAGVIDSGTTSRTLALSLANLNTLYEQIKLRNVTKGDKAVKARNETKYWLVISPSLEKTAWEIINQEKFVQGPTGEFVGERNYWKDKFDVKMFNQLSNTTYHSGALNGTWGLVPQNVKYSPFAMTLLNGQSKPVTETVDLPADELGFGVRGYWDVNLDYRPVENDKLQATAWSFPAN